MSADRDRETSLWGWLDRGVSVLPGHPHVQRIENSCSEGTPDVEGCIAGETFWTELKVAYPRANQMWLVKTTTAQIRKARRRRRAGGRSWFLIRLTGKTARLSRHILIEGLDAEALLDTPVSEEWLLKHNRLPDEWVVASIVLRTMAGN